MRGAFAIRGEPLIADRILVLYRGRLAVDVAGGDIDDHGLLHAINTGRLPGSEPAHMPIEEEVIR